MGRPPTITRDQVIRTARAVFTLKGFEPATLADIASQLHVTAAAVLRHFPSKQALFHAAMTPTVELPSCITELATIDASTDPRIVLRRVAEEWLPFARDTIAQHLVVTMHERLRRPAVVVPFDADSDENPPRKGLRLVTDYFRRARKAGVIDVDDPRAAALLFMGSLLSYVFIHYIMNVVPRPYPLPDYIDSLIELWTNGAIVQRKHGGTGVTKQAPTSEANRPARRNRSGGARGRPLPASDAKVRGAGAVRNPGSPDGKRGIAGRRPRNKRSN